MEKVYCPVCGKEMVASFRITSNSEYYLVCEDCGVFFGINEEGAKMGRTAVVKTVQNRTNWKICVEFSQSI